MKLFPPILILALVLSGCAGNSLRLQPTSLEDVQQNNQTAQVKVAHAQKVLLTLKDVHPDIRVQLRQVQSDLADAQTALGAQKVLLTSDQKQIDTLADSGNKAMADRDYYHHKSDTAAGLLWKWRLFFFISLVLNIAMVLFAIALRFFRTYLMSVPVIGPILSNLL